HCRADHQELPSFPTRRSSDLQSLGAGWGRIMFKVIFPNVISGVMSGAFITFAIVIGEFTLASLLNRPAFGPYLQLVGANRAYEPDRKSTRLNSSHVKISYAVF